MFYSYLGKKFRVVSYLFSEVIEFFILNAETGFTLKTSDK